jgi:hypothetical protein
VLTNAHAVVWIERIGEAEIGGLRFIGRFFLSDRKQLVFSAHRARISIGVFGAVALRRIGKRGLFSRKHTGRFAEEVLEQFIFWFLSCLDSAGLAWFVRIGG